MGAPKTQAEREGECAARLVDQAKLGDDRAFAELVRRYRRRIYALALHMTGSHSDADDIAQDVFIKAHSALHGFEGRSQFFTWVYRMTVNRSLNAKRDRDRRGERLIHDPRVELAVATDGRGDPRREIELRQTYLRLLGALDALNADVRTSVILVALQGLSHAEAAVVQDTTEGTVAWRMHEARNRLQRAMAKEPTRPLRPAAEPTSKAAESLLGALRNWLPA